MKNVLMFVRWYRIKQFLTFSNPKNQVKKSGISIVNQEVSPT